MDQESVDWSVTGLICFEMFKSNQALFKQHISDMDATQRLHRKNNENI
jgi:hypothetical protein